MKLLLETLLHNQQVLIRFLQKKTKNRSQAEDLFQQAWIQIKEKGEPTKPIENPLAFCYQVLHHLWVDSCRKAAREKRLQNQHQHEPNLFLTETNQIKNQEHCQENGNLCTCFYDILPSLKATYTQMIQEFDLQGSSLQSIAQKQKISKNGASVRLYRAHQALQKKLKKVCGACAKQTCLDCYCEKKTKKVNP